jgi:hypothetical protein
MLGILSPIPCYQMQAPGNMSVHLLLNKSVMWLDGMYSSMCPPHIYCEDKRVVYCWPRILM